MAISRKEALARVRRAVRRRQQALKRGNRKAADSALRVARRYRKIAQERRAAWRARYRKAPPVKYTFRSVKNFLTRPFIRPRLIVLHSTESSDASGFNVGSYLSHGSTQADCHIIVDSDGTTYRLVPDNRKAWHVGVSNSFCLGIEQVGRAGGPADQWEAAQLETVARWLAYYSRKFDIPLVDARKSTEAFTAAAPNTGVVTHHSLPGAHWDPGPRYPFEAVLQRAKRIKAGA